MKRDFNAVLVGFDGLPIKDGQPVFDVMRDPSGVIIQTMAGPIPKVGNDLKPVILEQAKDLTLAALTVKAMRPMRGDETIAGDVMLRMFKLTTAIVEASGKKEPVEIDDKDITLVKERIEKMRDAEQYGAACLLLDKDYVEAPTAETLITAALAGTTELKDSPT